MLGLNFMNKIVRWLPDGQKLLLWWKKFRQTNYFKQNGFWYPKLDPNFCWGQYHWKAFGSSISEETDIQTWHHELWGNLFSEIEQCSFTAEKKYLCHIFLHKKCFAMKIANHHDNLQLTSFKSWDQDVFSNAYVWGIIIFKPKSWNVVSVLLSAHIERVSVSRMQYFCFIYFAHPKKAFRLIFFLNIALS